MKYLNYLLALTGITLLIFSCSSSDESNSAEATSDAFVTQVKSSSDEQKVARSKIDLKKLRKYSNSISRKLLKTGSITFVTKDVDDSRHSLHQIIKDYDGYISSEQLDENTDKLYHKLTVRVPSDAFDDLVASVKSIAVEVENLDLDVKEITKEFIDLNARIKSKKDLQKKYEEIMNQTFELREVIQMEKEITGIRTEIEAAEGRLRYLTDRTSMSTLHINYYQTITPNFAFSSQFYSGFSNGWKMIMWIMIGLANIWPFAFVGLLLSYWFYRYNKRLKKIPA